MKAVYEWATAWQVPLACFADLLHRMGMGFDSPQINEIAGMSEAAVTSRFRLEVSNNPDTIFWRNNVGALPDFNGRLVRFGLANESKAMNEQVKSSDWIGIKRRLITQQMVGQTIGQFAARDIKHGDWKFNATDPHDAAQARYMGIVISYGGDAAFTNGKGSL